MATSLNLPDTSDGSDGDGARRRKSMLAIQNRSTLCTDPNCDTKLLRMKQELQLTKLKLKQLEHSSRKQQLQLQGRLNTLSNDFTQETTQQLQGEGEFLKPEEEKKKISTVKDDSKIKSSISKSKRDKVSASPRPKSSLAFVQIETVI